MGCNGTCSCKENSPDKKGLEIILNAFDDMIANGMISMDELKEIRNKLKKWWRDVKNEDH